MRWTLDDIRWDEFDATRVDERILPVVKAAALVEANSADYVAYLSRVFPNDPEFRAAAENWGAEEAQHGAALGRWAEMADPDFSFARALAWFRAGYRVPLDAEQSVRGSRAGELIARCVVESGTSSLYSAIRDACDEPVLRQIAHRIAADEFSHYQLFHKHLERYDAADLGMIGRLKVAVGRVREVEDDELGYAYFAANIKERDAAAVYDGEACAQAYYAAAFALYQRRHIDNATRMIMRASLLSPQGLVADTAVAAFWSFVKARRRKYAKAASAV